MYQLVQLKTIIMEPIRVEDFVKSESSKNTSEESKNKIYTRDDFENDYDDDEDDEDDDIEIFKKSKKANQNNKTNKNKKNKNNNAASAPITVPSVPPDAA